MEQSIIDYLFYNNDEMRKMIETNVEFENIESWFSKQKEQLKASFTNEQKEIFERFEENLIDEYNIVSRMFFKYGVKIGIRIVSEGMYDN